MTSAPASVLASPSPAAEAMASNKCSVARRRDWRVGTCLLLIAAAAWGLRTYRSGTASYWFDESSSWKTIQYGWSEIWTPISRNVHPPVYYLTLKSWALFWGDGPLSLRLFSATLGTVSALAAYALVREALQGTRVTAEQSSLAALLAAALVAVNGMHVLAGVHARMYPLGICLALVAGWMAIRVQRSGGRLIEWIVLALSGTALTLTHYYGLFTAAAIGLWLLGSLAWSGWRGGWSSRTQRLTVGVLLSGWGALNVWGLWLPSFLAQRAQVTHDYFIRPFEWNQLARMTLAMLTAPEQYGRVSVEAAWIACAGWGLVCMLVACFGGTGGRLVALAATLPVASGVAYCLSVRSIFSARYFLFAQVFLLIGWPLVLSRLPSRSCALALGLATVAWFSYWTSTHLDERDRRSQQHGLRDAAAVLEEWRSPEDVVIVGQGVIHPTIQQYCRAGRERIYVLDRGRPYPHYQGGPLLRDEEYLSVDRLESLDVARVFTVDVYDLWGRGSRFETRLSPARWKEVKLQWFREEYGQPCRVFVREYQRLAPPPTAQTHFARR